MELKGRRLLTAIIVLLSMAACSTIRGVVKGPMVWRVEDLNQMKRDTINSNYRSLIREAEDYCDLKPVVIINKGKTFAPDPHFYCSIGPYWWPDPDNPSGKYINKDGLINPEYYEYDAERLEEFVKRCKTLGKAYYLCGNEIIYNAFIKQLKAWFVDEETLMYPSLEYIQIVPGHNYNKGRFSGFIETYQLNDVIESIRLVNTVKSIDNGVLSTIQKWFLDYVTWMEEGDYGKRLREAQNNIGLAYDVTLVNVYLFCGYEDRAKRIVDAFADSRINTQILETGEQPAELIRTKAATYSLYNLIHIIDLCLISRYWYPDFYRENSQRLDSAFVFIKNAVDNPDSFPYEQITGWESVRSGMHFLLKRRNELMNGEVLFYY